MTTPAIDVQRPMRAVMVGWLVACVALTSCRGTTEGVMNSTVRQDLSVIIDTDLQWWGDDSRAILLLLRDASVRVLGITTTSGNVWTEEATANAVRLVDLIGRSDITVRSGLGSVVHADRLHYYWTSERALLNPRYAGALSVSAAPPTSDQQHDGPAQLPAGPRGPEFIVQQVLANPGRITLVGLGPATNIAAALRQEPRVASLVSRVYLSGGALRVPGNTTDQAEFNFWFDPESADAVLASNLPVTVIPLDATSPLSIDAGEFTGRGPSVSPDRTSTYLAESVRRASESQRRVRIRVWDEVVAAVVLHPDIVERSAVERVRVVRDRGPDYGAARIDDPPTSSRPQVTVVYEVSQSGFAKVIGGLLTPSS